MFPLLPERNRNAGRQEGRFKQERFHVSFPWNRLYGHSSQSCWISLLLLIATVAKTLCLHGGGTLCGNSLLPQRALPHICVGNGCYRILIIAMSSTSTEHSSCRFTGLLRDGVAEGHETDIRTQSQNAENICAP